MSPYHVPVTKTDILHTLAQFILTRSHRGRNILPHWRGWSDHTIPWLGLGLKLGLSEFKLFINEIMIMVFSVFFKSSEWTFYIFSYYIKNNQLILCLSWFHSCWLSLVIYFSFFFLMAYWLSIDRNVLNLNCFIFRVMHYSII